MHASYSAGKSGPHSVSGDLRVQLLTLPKGAGSEEEKPQAVQNGLSHGDDTASSHAGVGTASVSPAAAQDGGNPLASLLGYRCAAKELMQFIITFLWTGGPSTWQENGVLMHAEFVQRG